MADCRFCGAPLTASFVDLGATPLANSYLTAEDLDRPEPRYPLHARVCTSCWLVQVDDVVPPEAIFRDYAYFSSFSSGWVEHARRYCEAARARFGLGPDSRVVEIASNDGYLLKHFVAAGIPCLGIEPAENVAEAARAAGVPTECRFFGREAAADLAARGWQADLMAANNVMAHVPDLNDFIAGFALLLKPTGVVSIEVPHLLNLIRQVQFDTIYHEHFSYFSLLTAAAVLARHGLVVFDVEEVPTHGGSPRIWAGRGRTPSPSVAAILAAERDAGLDRLEGYAGFQPRVERLCRDLVAFLPGKRVAAYGAAAKGNTLLNVAGIGADRIPYVVDKNPHKQGHFLPGSRIPVADPAKVAETRPDYLLILPWNIAEEVARQMAHIRDWGGRFVTAVPEIRVW